MIAYRQTFFFFIAVALYMLVQPVQSYAQEGAEKESVASKQLQSEAWYYDALKAKFIGDYKQEELLLKKFIKERPDVAAAYYELANLLLNNNDAKEAEAYIRKAIAIDKTNLWYQLTYTDALKRQKKFDEAADVYSELAATGRNNKSFYYDAAYNYQRAGENKKAMQALDELIKVSPSDVENALLSQQELYVKMKEPAEALKIAEQLLKKYPKEGKYYSNLASIYLENNNQEAALKTYLEGLKAAPNEPSLQYGIALYYLKKEDWENYDTYISQAILNPDLDERIQAETLRRYLTDVEADSTRKKKALEIAKKLVAQQPESGLMQAFYGQILARNNQPDEAARYLKQALANDPDQYDIWQELLLTYVTNNQTDSLLATAKRALKFFPNNAIVHYFAGIGYLSKKESVQAIKSLNRAIELQSEDNKILLADMYSSLGDAFNNVKEYTRSDSAFETSLRLHSDNPSVLNNYSYYLSMRNTRLEAAEKMSKRSLELRPGEATFLDTYGWILYKQGKYQEAKRYVEDAIKGTADTDGTLWDHLGDINYKLNNIDEAVKQWQKAKDKGTENNLIDKKIQDRKVYEQ